MTHSRPDPKDDPSRVNYFHGALNCSLDMLYDINSGNLLAIIHDGFFAKNAGAGDQRHRRPLYGEKKYYEHWP